MIKKKIYYLNYYRLIEKTNAAITNLTRLTNLLQSIDAAIIVTITIILLIAARLKKACFNTIKINKLKILNFNNYYSRESTNS